MNWKVLYVTRFTSDRSERIVKEYFVEFNGKPLKSVKTAFESAVKQAGLAGRITPHTLRHTAATWLMQLGVDTWQAAGFLGMSVETLERTYGHHHPEYLHGAALAMSSRKPQSLVISLVEERKRRMATAQSIEVTGGARSPMRTRLSLQNGVCREILLKCRESI